jgi:hypothetical protein
MSTIIAGKFRPIKVMQARDLGEWKYKFVASANPVGVTNIVVVRTSPLRFDLVIVEPETILKDGDSKGGYIEVLMQREDDEYFVGDTKLAKVRDPMKI